MADPHRMTLAAYEALEFCNPVSADTLDRTLRWAEVAPGGRALDLGCGNAVMARHVAETRGLHVDAVERSEAVCDIARRKLDGRGAPGSVTLRQTPSKRFLGSTEPYDLVMCVGASAVVPGPPEPRAVMEALKPHVKPGGWLLWGDPYWKREPDPAFVAMLGPVAAYLPHADNIAAGEAAGFSLRFAATSSDREWEDYAFGIYAAACAWADAHADDPRDAAMAEEVRARAGLHRAAWLVHSRDTLGFGLYLFRA